MNRVPHTLAAKSTTHGRLGLKGLGLQSKQGVSKSGPISTCMSPSPAFPALGQWMVLGLSNCLSQSCTEYKCCDYRRTVGGSKKDQTSKWLEFEEEGPALPPKVKEHAVTNFYFQLQRNKHIAQALFGEEPLLKSHPFHSHCDSKDARYDFREGLPTISNTSPRFMAVGILSRYSPPEVERIWLSVYYNKNPIYAIFYLADTSLPPEALYTLYP